MNIRNEQKRFDLRKLKSIHKNCPKCHDDLKLKQSPKYVQLKINQIITIKVIKIDL